MTKKILLSALLCFLPLVAAEKEKLTVYTYDSFVSSWGPGPAVKKSFEDSCNCELNFISLSDGPSILNRLKLEGKNTKADVILGLDTNFITQAIKTGLIAKHKLDTTKLALPTKWENEYFIPYDFGNYAFIYNSDKIKNPPKSMEEFLNSKGSVIYQDPRTSTVGFGLLLWLKKIYKDDTKTAWKKLGKKTVTVTKGWSEAYNMFLKGESDYVLSYTTSPAYHQIAEKKSNYKAIEFKEGHYMQTEVAAKLTTTKHSKLADKFLDFILSKGFQKHIPTTNWMYPVIKIDLPKEFSELVKPKNLELELEKISKNKKSWIKEWQNSTIE